MEYAVVYNVFHIEKLPWKCLTCVYIRAWRTGMQCGASCVGVFLPYMHDSCYKRVAQRLYAEQARTPRDWRRRKAGEYKRARIAGLIARTCRHMKFRNMKDINTRSRASSSRM